MNSKIQLGFIAGRNSDRGHAASGGEAAQAGGHVQVSPARMQTENKPLTAIRGFAALWVVAYHLNDKWPFPGGPHVQAVLSMGYAAVDVFFVLSGFILTLVYRDLVGAGTGSFALRRICRIYPLHLCIMVVLGLMGLYTQWKHGEAHPWQTYWPAVILVQPFLGIETDWNVPSWSLGVELACYTLFPLVNRLMRPISRSGLIGAVLILAIIELMVLRMYEATAAGPGAVLRALAGFFLGAALARLFLHGSAGFARYATVLQLAALTALAIAVTAGFSAGAVLAAAGLIVAIASPAGPVVRLLSVRAFVWLGRISFSIYLLHIPLLTLFDKLAPVHAAVATPSLRYVVAGVLLVVLLALSELTYRLIELPFRRLPALLAPRPQVAFAPVAG